MLIDGYQRQFAYVRLSITDVCNFKCNYCLPDGYDRRDNKVQGNDCAQQTDLSVAEIKRLVSTLAAEGVSKIRITGGEPALRKDLTKIIEVIAQTPGIKEIALTTNGFNLKHNIATWQRAGLTQLNVSIDSLIPEQFQLITGSRQFTRVMDGLQKAIALGIPCKVNTVMLAQYNLGQWHQFLQWIKTTPVSLRFIELMQTGDNTKYFHDNHVNAEHFYRRLQARGWSLKAKSPTTGPALTLTHPDYVGTIGFIMPYSKDFCASCNRLRVTSRGAMHPCLFADEGHSLRHLLQDDSQQPLLQHWLRQQLLTKAKAHQLHAHHVGATKHLAMLGG